MSQTAYNDEALYAADISYTYEDGTNRLTESKVATKLHGVYMQYLYGSLWGGLMPDAVYDVGRGGVVVARLILAKKSMLAI